MSRAFVKDDAPEGQPFVPPRAPLPPGVLNYVTPRGLALLRAELAELEAERGRLQADRSDEAERKRQLAVLGGRIAELDARLASARVVDPRAQPQDEVRFGATVTLRTASDPRRGEERRFTIVGVDEAAAGEGRVAFVAPIARAILGRRVGEQATLQTARGPEVLEITALSYDAE
jgi:transcription elongation factor GreB